MKLIADCLKTGRDPETGGYVARHSLRRRLSAELGFTLVEVTIVVLLIGMLSAVAVPNYVKARNDTQVKACIANLKQISSAKQQWSLEMVKADTAVPTSTDLESYFHASRMPDCPAGGTYRIRRVTKDPSCTRLANGHALSNLNMDDDPYAD